MTSIEPQFCDQGQQGRSTAPLSNRRQRGYLVCFEGIDGSGKSAAAESIFLQLRACGIPTIWPARNGADACPELAEIRLDAIGQMLWHYPPDCAIQRLGDKHLIHLLVSWFHLFDVCVLRPHLDANEIVLVDRWFYKYVARFALKPAFHGVDVETWFHGISTPDVVFSMALAPEIAWLRKAHIRKIESGIEGSASLDRKRNFIDYQTNVQKVLSLYQLRYHWQRIDSSRPLDQVSAEASTAILSGVADRFRETGCNQTFPDLAGHK